MPHQSINPANGKLIRTYREMSRSEWQSVLVQTQRAAQAWRRVSLKDRARKMRKAADLLDRNKERYARLMANEMGKPLQQGRSEIEKCALTCRFYAQKAASFLKPQIVKTEGARSYIAFEPLGVVLAVMPWNFPFWQVIRFAAPTLMAGNGGVLKHASNVTGCALELEKLFREAGFPKNLFRTVLVGSKNVSKIIEHPAIQAVTLTGSTPAGRSVAAKAGACIKKTVLELGGSDPYVILEDADLERAAQHCADSRMINAGQSCVAAKRFIVIRSVQKKFERLFVSSMTRKALGGPLSEATEVGPLARVDLRDSLHDQVVRSIRKGAKVLLGGKIPQIPGAFYPPTVLSNVRPGMPAYDEEMFGPVASIISAKNAAEAIRIANDVPFGLGAAVFTRNIKRGERIAAHELEAGCCVVNTSVRSDPRLPFGGIKESGYGRELSAFGIREFVNIKTVCIAKK